jgi:hypothetical protein
MTMRRAIATASAMRVGSVKGGLVFMAGPLLNYSIVLVSIKRTMHNHHNPFSFPFLSFFFV